MVSSCLLVAAYERRLVGYVSGYCHATFYAGCVTAWVDELLVLEPFRDTGVGRQLMDAFEDWANDRKSVVALRAVLRATFKFCRQATDQIVGTSDKGASFLNGFL